MKHPLWNDNTSAVASTMWLTNLGPWSGWNVARDVVEIDVST